jgi:transcription elongation factor GreB
VARALIKAREGDTVTCTRPAGDEEIEIVEVRYEAIPIDAFVAPRGAWNPNT